MARRKGTDGPDSLVGTQNDDRITGGGGNDTLEGAEGNDFIVGGEGDDRIAGGGGIDTVSYGGLADDQGVLLSLRDGTAGGTDGTDLLLSIENVSGSQYADDITGDAEQNLLNGKGGNDTLRGAGDDDVLIGGLDDDGLFGGNGMDTLWGGKGQDVLVGGAAADTFFYRNLGSARGELIGDLTNEDVIDLSGIDADITTDGDQAFTLVDQFTGTPGELVMRIRFVDEDVGVTVIRGDVDGDGNKDFEIQASGEHLDFTNFVL